MSPLVDPQLDRILDEEFYDELSTTEREQLYVLFQAFGIFQERNARRRDLWKAGGAADSLFHCQSKVARMKMDGFLPAEERAGYLDDPIDLINFAAFYVRNVRDGRLG